MRGTRRHMILGNSKFLITSGAVICPPIQSIVVVTSPIGDQAPPALAAMIINPTKNNLISRLGMSFRIKDTITMVVVRLSKTADRKKVIQQTIHNNFLGSRVLIISVINLKP